MTEKIKVITKRDIKEMASKIEDHFGMLKNMLTAAIFLIDSTITLLEDIDADMVNEHRNKLIKFLTSMSHFDFGYTINCLKKYEVENENES